MNILGKWKIFTGSILLMLLAVYLCLPYALTRIAKYYLTQEGIHLEKLEIDFIRPWSAHIDALEFLIYKEQENEERNKSGPTIRVTCKNVNLGYHPESFQDKQLDHINVKELEIIVLNGEQERTSMPTDSVSFLPSRWMKLIPSEEINIENFDIVWKQEEAGGFRYHILGSMIYKDDAIESEVRVESIDGKDKKVIDLSLGVNEKDQLNLQIHPEQDREQDQEQGQEQDKEKVYVNIRSILKEAEQGIIISGKANVDIRKLLSEASRFGLDKKGEVSSTLNTLEIEDNIEIDFRATSKKVQAKTNVKLYEKYVDAHIEVHHNFSSLKGEATVELKPFEFSNQTRVLSSMITPWEYPFDITYGEFSGNALFIWESLSDANEKERNNIRLARKYQFKASGLSGFYNEIHFSGLNAEGRLDDGYGYSLRTSQPVKVSIQQINSGVPVTSVSFGLSVFPETIYEESKSNDNVIYLHDLKGHALGGKIFSKKVKFDPSSEINNLIINLKGISLNKILELQEQEGVEGTGVIDGILPIKISSKGLSISDGNLEARKPGGIIRYRPSNTEAFTALPDPNIRLVMEALDNFHYKVLQSGVTYSPEGELILDLRLKGRNPDMTMKRPVNLNVNVEQNILTLLKSLRLADDIGEKIGERMKK